jgi:pimeloyl-ACP methyl ester carboxylesterase
MGETEGQLQSIYATIGGLACHARVSLAPARPDLAPVVLVHGLSVSSRYMVPTAKRLAPYRRVFAPDLPGFGKSAHPQRILGISELADALIAWTDYFGLGRMVLLGNSLGCQIIADVALRWPARVERIILVGPTVDWRARSLLAQAGRLAVDVAREPISSILTQGRDYWASGLRRTVGTMRLALDDRIEQKLPHVNTPTLIVRGEEDPIAPQRWCEELARRAPHGRLAVIPRAPHAANYDAPGALARLTLDFLDD